LGSAATEDSFGGLSACGGRSQVARLHEHKTGSLSGHLIGEFILLHTEQAANYADARIREEFLKFGHSREWLDLKYPKKDVRQSRVL
jgi:hypothetical protein